MTEHESLMEKQAEQLASGEELLQRGREVMRRCRQVLGGMEHCPDCGAYLGDWVGGVLYRFGARVYEAHTCERG